MNPDLDHRADYPCAPGECLGGVDNAGALLPMVDPGAVHLPG